MSIPGYVLFRQTIRRRNTALLPNGNTAVGSFSGSNDQICFRDYAGVIASQCGLAWGEVLNNLFQINGDIADPSQTVYFYCVENDISGDRSDFYRTYCLQGEIQNNVSPTLFAIVDDFRKCLGTAFRKQSEHDACSGNDSGQNGVAAITLTEGQMYTLAGVLTYYAKDDQTKNATANRVFAGNHSDDKERPRSIRVSRDQGLSGGILQADLAGSFY